MLDGLASGQAFTTLSDGHGGTYVEEASAGHTDAVAPAVTVHHDLFGG